MTYRYRLVDGVVRSEILVPGHRLRTRGEDRPDKHFSQTLLKAYYRLECEQNFRSTYTKNQIKRAHETAIQRFEQTGAET